MVNAIIYINIGVLIFSIISFCSDGYENPRDGYEKDWRFYD